MHKPSFTNLVRSLSFAAVAIAASAASAEEREPVVATSDGRVRGISSDGVDRFLGIPYAAPPVGDLRWKPPQPHGHWTGVREATAFANHCPQTASPFGLASTTEDCLYLNIFRPARDGDDDEEGDEEGDDSPEEGLAVMV